MSQLSSSPRRSNQHVPRLALTPRPIPDAALLDLAVRIAETDLRWSAADARIDRLTEIVQTRGYGRLPIAQMARLQRMVEMECLAQREESPCTVSGGCRCALCDAPAGEVNDLVIAAAAVAATNDFDEFKVGRLSHWQICPNPRTFGPVETDRIRSIALSMCRDWKLLHSGGCLDAMAEAEPFSMSRLPNVQRVADNAPLRVDPRDLAADMADVRDTLITRASEFVALRFLRLRRWVREEGMFWPALVLSAVIEAWGARSMRWSLPSRHDRRVWVWAVAGAVAAVAAVGFFSGYTGTWPQ